MTESTEHIPAVPTPPAAAPAAAPAAVPAAVPAAAPAAAPAAPAAAPAVHAEPPVKEGPALFPVVLGILGLVLAGAILVTQLTDLRVNWGAVGPGSILVLGLLVIGAGLVGLTRAHRREQP